MSLSVWARNTFVERRPPWALFAVLVIVGFLLVVTGTATSIASRTEEPRRQALVNQILEQRKSVDRLDETVAELRGEVATERDKAANNSAAERSQQRETQELAMRAGTTALEGSGIVVRLSDAPRKVGEDATSFGADRIQDGDVQLVVNALFASGAEAVAVNDNRVVAVTPIRAAGGTIVINYRPVSSPYRIVAIGADQHRFESTEVAVHFREWKKKFELGYSVEHHKKVSVPAYSGRVGIDVAEPEVAQVPATSTTTTGGN